MKICLYGPPGSGKSAVGQCLAHELRLPFFDLDREIEIRAGTTIPEIFARQGEAAFRFLEREELNRLLDDPGEMVISLGAGALLDETSRKNAERAGTVVCLSASRDALVERLENDRQDRPLLAGEIASKLDELLQSRGEHYAAFPIQVESGQASPQEAAWQVQIHTGHFRVDGMGAGYPVTVQRNGLEEVGYSMKRLGLSGPVALVSDENVAPGWANRVSDSLTNAGYETALVVLPAGETAKNLETLSSLWRSFAEAGLQRGSTVLCLGGGVVTDLGGFAAATYLRGIAWVAAPTSLLGMVDASLGGKTGIDLKFGKNLVGAFYAPRLVLTDPELLSTLPEVELRNGLAEIVKHAVIADAELFEVCSRGWNDLAAQPRSGEVWDFLVRRAMAVKIQILREDPYEQNRRIVLNLGHTLGHALEQASGYQLRHGEAVAIGMAAEARLGEELGVTTPGLSEIIADVLTRLGLPTQIPAGLEPDCIRQAIQVDKKRQGDRVKLPLPVTIGKANEGIEIEEEKLWTLFSSCMDLT